MNGTPGIRELAAASHLGSDLRGAYAMGRALLAGQPALVTGEHP